MEILYTALGILFTATIMTIFSKKAPAEKPKPVVVEEKPKTVEVMNPKYKQVLKYAIENLEAVISKGNYRSPSYVTFKINDSKNLPNITSIGFTKNYEYAEFSYIIEGKGYSANIGIKTREIIPFSETLDLGKEDRSEVIEKIKHNFEERKKTHGESELRSSTDNISIRYIDEEITKLLNDKINAEEIRKHNERLELQVKAIDNFLSEV